MIRWIYQWFAMASQMVAFQDLDLRPHPCFGFQGSNRSAPKGLDPLVLVPGSSG
ncbi:hypothetical protein Hdeb2414_s0005g00182071 [Helianthus debilis subsp. tardiflorus]